MEPLEYIKKFKMDQPNYWFNRKEFASALGLELIDQIKESSVKNSQTGYAPYIKFKELVLGMDAKYKAISNILVQKGLPPLSKELWGAFYSNWVVPIRTKLYPYKAKEIALRKSIKKVNKKVSNPLSSNLDPDVYQKLQTLSKELSENS